MTAKALDRTIRIKSLPIEKIPFAFADKTTLDNQVSLFTYHDAEAEVVRIEFQFPAGTSFSVKKLDAAFTNRLINSGTSKLTEKQLSERIDYYGSYFEKHLANDEASFVVYSLKKYTGEVLKVVSDILRDPVFPEHELETLRSIRKQKFLVKNEKVGFLARKEFTHVLYGKNHPYGGKVELADYDKLNREDLLHFHRSNYLVKPVILAAGNVDDKVVGALNELFGKEKHSSTGSRVDFFEPEFKTGRIFIEKKNSVQNAIRMGRRMFNRKHKDFPEMQVLIMALGGYFGSRLMSNLREDKGFTYGVGAGLSSLLHDGYFYISTEVGSEVCRKAEQEIKNELRKIREELIPEDELELVKNYILGQILRSTDGVFASMDRFKTLHFFGQSQDEFQQMIQRIRKTSAPRLLELANEWLREEDMLTVVAGDER